MAQIILAALEERTEHGAPGGDRMEELHAAGDWVGDILVDALEDALLLTAGSVLKSVGLDAVTSDATAADDTYPVLAR